MAEVQAAQQPTFKTIQFVTKDGEKCTATKNNGIVTVSGDKNGIRQVPLDQFMKGLIETLPKNVDLARTPANDTVQFSGNEEPQKAEPATATEESVEETNKKLNKKYLGIAAAALAVVGTGIYLLGRGKWWSKAAKEVEQEGKKLVNDATNAVEDGLIGGNKSGKATEKSVDNVVTQTEEHVDTSVKTTPKTTQKNQFVATSPIPKEQILEIPKDLELDVEKVVKQGREVGRGFDTAGKGVDTVTYTISTPYGYRAYRVHVTDGKPIKIQDILDYGKDSRPFRTFEIKQGQVRSITDNTTESIHKRFFDVEIKNNCNNK